MMVTVLINGMNDSADPEIVPPENSQDSDRGGTNYTLPQPTIPPISDDLSEIGCESSDPTVEGNPSRP